MTERLSNESFPEIKESYDNILRRIDDAKRRSGRTGEVRLMAVTKTQPVEKVNYAASLGISLLGENRVQEFLGKCDDYSKKCEIHFIGGLQNNKVKYIIDKVSMIESVDSYALAAEIDKRAKTHGSVMDILLEVNIGSEPTKSGALPGELLTLAEQVCGLRNIRLCGLMAIPPREDSERWFEKVRVLYDECRTKLGEERFSVLSMGMSGDFETAIEYGASIVRIGSLLFGQRHYNNI